MINYFSLFSILGLLSVLSFSIFERIRFINGKEMITDKFLSFLQKIYDRTAPKNSDEPEIHDYHLSDKAILRIVYFDDKG